MSAGRVSTQPPACGRRVGRAIPTRDCITPCDHRQRGNATARGQGIGLGGCKVRTGRTRLTPGSALSCATRSAPMRTAIALPTCCTRASSTAPSAGNRAAISSCWVRTRAMRAAAAGALACSPGGGASSSSQTSIVSPAIAAGTSAALSRALVASRRAVEIGCLTLGSSRALPAVCACCTQPTMRPCELREMHLA